MSFYDKKKDHANLMAFREQAVEDGYFQTKGKMTLVDGYECISVNQGEQYEFYSNGAQGLTFKLLGCPDSFNVSCEDLPYPEYHAA
jgi:hypothetical protein